MSAEHLYYIISVTGVFLAGFGSFLYLQFRVTQLEKELAEIKLFHADEMRRFWEKIDAIFEKITELKVSLEKIK